MPERPEERGGGLAPPSLLRAGARFEGLLALRAPGRIDGCVSGEVIASDLLWIGRSARVNARIEASEIVIEGEFDGEAEASGRIELLQTARVRARLDTPRLVLVEGCFFEGRCRTDSESEDQGGREDQGGSDPPAEPDHTAKSDHPAKPDHTAKSESQTELPPES